MISHRLGRGSWDQSKPWQNIDYLGILEDNHCLCILQVAQPDFIGYLETSGHTDISDYTLGQKTKHKDKNVRKGLQGRQIASSGRKLDKDRDESK